MFDDFENLVEVKPSELTYTIEEFDVLDQKQTKRLSLCNSEKSQTLYYKILSNANERYILNKHKGSLLPGETVNIEISFLINQLRNLDELAKKRDVFKIQYFRSLGGKPIGEIFVNVNIVINADKNRLKTILSKTESVRNGGHNLSRRDSSAIKAMPNGDVRSPRGLANGYYGTIKEPSIISINEESQCWSWRQKCIFTVLLTICVLSISFQFLMPVLFDAKFRQVISSYAEAPLSTQEDSLATMRKVFAQHLLAGIENLEKQHKAAQASGRKDWMHFSTLLQRILVATIDLFKWMFDTNLSFINLISNIGWLGLGLLIMYYVKSR